MKTYRVSFDLILDDEAAHPRKWVAQCIWDALRLKLVRTLTTLSLSK